MHDFTVIVIELIQMEKKFIPCALVFYFM